jgi:hypothetical protein
MVTVPADRPVTIPAGLMAAMPGLLLLHMPPRVALASGVDVPEQTLVAPVMGDTTGSVPTVRTAVDTAEPQTPLAV